MPTRDEDVAEHIMAVMHDSSKSARIKHLSHLLIKIRLTMVFGQCHPHSCMTMILFYRPYLPRVSLV